MECLAQRLKIRVADQRNPRPDADRLSDVDVAFESVATRPEAQWRMRPPGRDRLDKLGPGLCRIRIETVWRWTQREAFAPDSKSVAPEGECFLNVAEAEIGVGFEHEGGRQRRRSAGRRTTCQRPSWSHPSKLPPHPECRARQCRYPAR